MNVLKGFFQNTRKPVGFGGRLMLSMMNFGHQAHARWGLSHMKIPPTARILDIGCGGGRNIQNLLSQVPQGRVYGVDYSQESVKKSKRVNERAILQGRAKIEQAEVSSLPFGEGELDIVTAFETIYFWPNLLHDFMEVRRVLKGNGLFFICNELSRPKGSEKWVKMLDFSVYTKVELKNTLFEAGFCTITCHEHRNGKWLCAIARKPSEQGR